MKRLATLGASGHGKVIADIGEQCGWEKIVFFDDAWPEKTSLGKWEVIGDSETLLDHLENSSVLVAIGNNTTRLEKLEYLGKAGGRIQVLIHPSAIISRYAQLEAGAVVMPNVVVNCDTQIGMGGILNTACTIDHDCILRDAVHISPGAHLAGNVLIGEKSWVGIGASVRQGVVIGENVNVGAGAVVVSDLPSGVTAVGVPARY